MSEYVLDVRAQQVLRLLVNRYIDGGKPVGSRTLSRDSQLDLSPATIRNVMSDLEDLGLLVAPHTSSGRIPTEEGFRLFIDSLINIEMPKNGDIEAIRDELNTDKSTEELLDSASVLLSGMTHLAGLVMIPRRDAMRFRHIEFLPLSDNRVLAILVVNEDEVQNKILQVSRTYSPSELEQMSNYLNELCVGKNIVDVRQQLLREMGDVGKSVNGVTRAAIGLAEQTLSGDVKTDMLVAGQNNLMDFHELAELETLRHLFQAFVEKRELLSLLDQCLSSDGLQIFIGRETGYRVLDNCSVVTAPYSLNGDSVGVLGVIGPTRMSYEKIIPVVNVTAKFLGAALNR